MRIFSISAPRWVIFLADILICLSSTIIAYLLRFNFDIPNYEIDTFYKVLPYVVIIRSITFYIAKIYTGIIRYTSSKDTERVFITVSIGSIIFSITNLVTYYTLDGVFIIPFSIVIIDYLVTTFAMITYRIIIKIAYFESKSSNKDSRNIIIFGAGEAGSIAKRAMDRDAGASYKAIAFLDDDPKKINRKLEGIKIFSSDKLDDLLTENEIDQVIVSIQKLSTKKLNEITEICLKYNTKVLHVPPVSKWINGELSFKQIKTLRIEDLLGRKPIKLDVNIIKKQISNKVVLVTGAAGSIGSEIVRQVSVFKPKQVVLLDQAESALYELELEMHDRNLSKRCEIVIGDVRNYNRMKNLLETFKPNIVFHAAAYKHVPLMEENPSEAVHTNVIGTKILADLSVECGVKTFVMVSTDKAVNPTNVMGSSKRIAEMYTQALNQTVKTNFITTRFGNVLGSNGSVIPLFRRQIESGGPITVTDPEITRYFMTIPEATQLVLEAGAMGEGGEIFIFDMGESVKIVDLAKKMVKLSGLTLGKDIQIVYTGLRPGEKLYEELLNDKENTLPTHHSQIMIAKTNLADMDVLVNNIERLKDLLSTQENKSIVSLMKEMVPEYRSHNSIYEELDVN